MNNEESKCICTSCKYFRRYYIISHDCRFKPTTLGQCVHSKIRKNVASKLVRKNEGCDLWQPYELQKLDIQYRMELVLEKISRMTSDILTLLRDME